MDINKRTILWIVFSLSLVMLWNEWLVSTGKPSMFAPAPTPVVAKGADGKPLALPGALPAASAGGAAALPGAAAPAGVFKSERVTITTDVMKVDIDTMGGQVKRLELLKYKGSGSPGWFGGCFSLFEWCKPDTAADKNEVLFDEGTGHIYVAQTGLIGTGSAGAALPNHNTGFIAKPGPRMLDNGNQVQLVLEAEQGGVKLTKTFTFKRGDYVVDVRHEVSNLGTAPVKPELYMQLIHDGTPPVTARFQSSFTGPTLYTGADHYKKLSFEKIEKQAAESVKTGRPAEQDHAVKSDDGWFAISQHFFVSAFVPQDKAPRDIFTKKIDTNVYAIGNVLPLPTIAPGASVTMDAKLYSGPQESKYLEPVTPGLELVKDYGFLTIIAKPIFWVMEHIHAVLGNWGWTIIVFTILIKLLFFPLSAAGYRSMAKMKLVTPKMQAIRERYKGDPQKMNQATMELYKTEKINPLGSCLPIVVQMPVFIALYWVLGASVEIRGAPWIGWIQDLAQHDPWCILPVLYAVSMFITTKLNPAPADPMQAKMMLFMPLAFSVMFFFFPSGLVLYWVVNNVLSIAQQWVITKRFAAPVAKA